MPASHRSALLALGAALALCACRPDARAQPGGDPQAPPETPRATPRETPPETPSETPRATPLACAGPSDPACGPDAYCKAESAQPNTGGRCAPRPQMCPMIYQPVCGGDGRTYPNACHAARAGVNAAHSGACEKPEP